MKPRMCERKPTVVLHITNVRIKIQTHEPESSLVLDNSAAITLMVSSSDSFLINWFGDYTQ